MRRVRGMACCGLAHESHANTQWNREDPCTATTPEELLCERMDTIYRFALKRTGDAVEADDLAQDIVVEILRSLPSLRDPTAFVGWMWRIAHRSWWSWVQSRQRHRLTCNVSGFESMADLQPQPQGEEMAEEQIVRMRKAVALLGRSYRQVLVLHHLRGMSTPEIARHLGLPVGTVGWRLHEARRQARRGMKEMKSNGERSYAPGTGWPAISLCSPAPS